MTKRTIEERFLAAIDRTQEKAQKKARGKPKAFRSLVPELAGGVPTFVEAPHEKDAKGSDVVVFGLPYEGYRARDTRTMVQPGAPLENTLYARDGASQAPDWIRRNSLHYSLLHGPGLFGYEFDAGFRLTEALSLSDAGNLVVDYERTSEEVLHEASDRMAAVLGETRIPVILGGDDIIPYVGVRTVQAQRSKKIAVVKFDAHFDLCWEPRYWAGSAWARAMEAGYLEPENLAIIGVRGWRNADFFGEVAKEFGIPWYSITDIEERGILDCVQEAINRVGSGTDCLYLSFDVDVMDPAFLPAQKYPEPAGMTAREAILGLRAAVDSGPTLCGVDITCLSPQHDVNGLGGQLAARLVVETLAAHGRRLVA